MIAHHALVGLKIAFIGGDGRQVELISACANQEWEIILIGYNREYEKLGGKVSKLEEIVLSSLDVIIFPVSGLEEDGRIKSSFSDDTIFFSDQQFACLQQKCLLITGVMTPYLYLLTKRFQLKVIELFQRDEIAIYNSIPTAEGAIKLAIEHTDITIHRAQMIVLGLGRTGMTLARSLKALGAFVKVGARKESDLARAYEMGLEPFPLHQLANQVHEIDVLFNTIPALMICQDVIAALSQQAVIIDLASNPGGTDFLAAQANGIKAILAPGLPGIVAPRTAGKILAKSLVTILRDFFTTKGENHDC